MKTIPLLLAALTGLSLASGKPQQLTSPDQVPTGLEKSDWSSIRAAYEAGRHAIHRQENGTLTARNPGQQWCTEFDGKGFLTIPDHGQWTWGLELIGYGELALLPAPSALSHIGGKVTCQRDARLTEWFINDTRGLEQGWTIQSKPSPATESLTLNLTVRGDLKAQVSPDSSSVAFQTPSGTTALTYGGLKAWDTDGKTLPVRFERAGETAIRITVEDKHARYPITIDPIAEQAYLKASYLAASAFGYSVAVSGDTVVVGAPWDFSSTTGVNSIPDYDTPVSGAAYVFIRSGATWIQQAYLKASNTGEDDHFGLSVAVSGDTVVVGAYGEDSSTKGVNSTPNNSARDSGAAYVFTRNGTTWSQQAYLKAANAGTADVFGISVAVSGDTVVVGANQESSSTTGINSTPNNSSEYSGAAYVFTRSGTTWSQQAYLKASNTGEWDFFGSSVSVSGNTVVVGAVEEDSSTTGVNSTPNESANESGAAYVFTRSGTTWSQQAYLKSSNTELWDNFGSTVAVSGDTAIIGAHGEDSSTTGVNTTPNNSAVSAGAAYVFTRSGTTWSQQAYLKASNTGAGDKFGYSVAVSGDTVVVGAYREDSSTTGVNSTPNESASDSGAAYVFTRSGTTWSQQAYLKASNSGWEDQFGQSVAVSGDTIVSGAFRESSSTTGVNSTPDNNQPQSGAAYLFSGFVSLLDLPTITSQTSIGVTSNSANLGGNVISQGKSAITSRGVVYSLASTNPLPEISGLGVVHLATSGTTGTFAVLANDLAPSSTYVFRAYATNANGTSYSDVSTFAITPQEIAVEQPAGKDLADGKSTANFGNVKTGGTNTLTFTIRNKGFSPLSSISASIGGANSVDFSISTLPATIVAASETTSFSVQFNPTSPGTRSATLQITSNDADENPFDITLTGNGTAPEIAVESPVGTALVDGGASVGFATTIVGSNSTLKIRIRNTGNEPLTGIVATVAGGNAAEFTVITRPASFLAPLRTTDMVLRFSPLVAGGRTATLQITSNDADENPFDISLTGTAVSPEISVEQPVGTNLLDGTATVGFGETLVGGTAFLDFTIRNVGTSNLTGISAKLTGGNAKDFSVVTRAATVAAPNVATTLRIRFAPKLLGLRTTTLQIASNDADEKPFDITLTATAVAPEIDVEQPEGIPLIDGRATVNFGSVPANGNAERTFRIRNTGTAGLSGILATFKGGQFGDFAVTGIPDTFVPVGGMTTLAIRFAPKVVGKRSTSLQIASNDANENPFDIVLTGTAVAALAPTTSPARMARSVGDTRPSDLAMVLADPAATPHSDGVSNLLKYAFNMNLSGSDSRTLVSGTGNAGLPAIGLTGTGSATMMRVEFLRRKGSGLIYTPMRSSSLAPGSFVAMSGTPVVTSIDENWERVVVEESANPATLPKSFAMVEVRLP